MNITRALFILRHGSYEGRKKYLEAVQTIEDELNRQKALIEESCECCACKLLEERDSARAEIIEQASLITSLSRIKTTVINDAKAEAVKVFAEIIVADYPQMEYYLNEIAKEFTEGEQK